MALTTAQSALPTLFENYPPQRSRWICNGLEFPFEFPNGLRIRLVPSVALVVTTVSVCSFCRRTASKQFLTVCQYVAQEVLKLLFLQAHEHLSQNGIRIYKASSVCLRHSLQSCTFYTRGHSLLSQAGRFQGPRMHQHGTGFRGPHQEHNKLRLS